MKTRYAKTAIIENSNRQWPANGLTSAPKFCAVDLRDGNQALPNPMTPEQKLEYFGLLVKIGFKEIEIGFPSASEDDYAFCRELIENNYIPDDVTISVLTQSRDHLIKKTIEAVAGAKNVIIHQYIATSDLHTKHVFGMDRDEVIKTAVESCAMIKEGVAAYRKAGNFVGLEFSPEEFTDTDLDFAVDVCMAVVKEWGPEDGEKVILNLPMTVERVLPNEYADMIEVFKRKNSYPENTVISVHAHNDMGCAVAATLMTLMAGADRVEGTLLGHGERTGNLDLITLALDLEYKNVDTGLDFSDLPTVVSTVEEITDMPVHPRHPYAGQLVFTAFSGSHQDAIHKGLNNRQLLAEEFGGWKIPYLHVDPGAIGRSFEKFIRINSQSGKGGVAFIMENVFHIEMPKWAQNDFANHVQLFTDKNSKEISADDIWLIFEQEYLELRGDMELVKFWPRPDDDDPGVIKGEAKLMFGGKEFILKSDGNGPISALVSALRQIDKLPDFVLDDYFEDSTGHSADAQAICFVNLVYNGKKYVGAGMDPNTSQAAAKAVCSGLNRLMMSLAHG